MENLKQQLEKKKKQELVDMIVALKQKLLNVSSPKTSKDANKAEEKAFNYTGISLVKDGNQFLEVELKFNLDSGDAIVSSIKKKSSHMAQFSAFKIITDMTIKQKK